MFHSKGKLKFYRINNEKFHYALLHILTWIHMSMYECGCLFVYIWLKVLDIIEPYIWYKKRR